MYTVFQKNRTPKTGWNNIIKIGLLWVTFSEDASTFNWELTAFEKLDMSWVPTARFPWQQQHHAGALIQEAITRPELKPLVVKVWGWLSTDHRWQGPYQWRKQLQACVQTKGQHFEQLMYFVLALIVYCCIDSKFSMIEKSRRNDWCISVLCLCYVYNCLIIL